MGAPDATLTVPLSLRPSQQSPIDAARFDVCACARPPGPIRFCDRLALAWSGRALVRVRRL